MNTKITIREYREGDETSIMKLRGLVFADSKSMDWWVWQHKQNPAGEAIIIVGDNEKEQGIVGHVCFMPLRIKIRDEDCLAAVIVDIMVHPDYRGHGLYGQLRLEAIKIAQQNNILFTSSFPNEISSRIRFRIPGSKTIFKKTPLWIKPFQVENIVTMYFKKNNMLNPLLVVITKGITRITDRSRNYQIRTQVREVKEIDDRFDILWEKGSSLHRIMMVRDKAFLDWRYIKKPDAEYTIYISEQSNQLLGYVVLRIIEDNGLKTGWIADILTSAKNSLAAMDLIAKAIHHCKAMGVDMIMCVMPPKAYLAPTLRKHGFSYSYKLLRKLNPIRIAPILPKHPEVILVNPSNWYLTRGDSDLI